MYILETRPCYNNVFMAEVKCLRSSFFFFIVKKKCFMEKVRIKPNLNMCAPLTCVITKGPEDDGEKQSAKEGLGLVLSTTGNIHRKRMEYFYTKLLTEWHLVIT